MWKIWFKVYYNGRYIGQSVSTIYALKKSELEKEARRMYRDHAGCHYEWVVAMENPFEKEGGESDGNEGNLPGVF